MWYCATEAFWRARDACTDAFRVHAFDLDHTLVVPRTGSVHPKTPDDWRWWHATVPDKVRALAAAPSSCVLVVSNQSRGGKGDAALAAVMHRVALVVQALGECALCVMVATRNNEFRKPELGCWRVFEAMVLEKCMSVTLMRYVGDAAGRPAAGALKADFSDSDAKFAANLMCPFQTPEEFFLGQPALVPPLPNWGDMLQEHKAAQDGVQPSPVQEVVVLVGAPASGKSSLAAAVFAPAGYVHVSRDVMGTAAKCTKATAQALQAGKSVVVDNTNPSVKARAPFIAAAVKAGVAARAVHVATDPLLRAHMHAFREAMGGKSVPGVAVATYAKNLVAPSTAEGFAQVVTVTPRLCITDPEMRRRFCQHH
jgi:bifunctional polynucleotide phosphatase/kinase